MQCALLILLLIACSSCMIEIKDPKCKNDNKWKEFYLFATYLNFSSNSSSSNLTILYNKYTLQKFFSKTTLYQKNYITWVSMSTDWSRMPTVLYIFMSNIDIMLVTLFLLNCIRFGCILLHAILPLRLNISNYWLALFFTMCNWSMKSVFVSAVAHYWATNSTVPDSVYAY